MVVGKGGLLPGSISILCCHFTLEEVPPFGSFSGKMSSILLNECSRDLS